ncbi:MAG: hypothetical protein ACKERG_01240 [Candidatus Hodgkinia cicadicola]
MCFCFEVLADGIDLAAKALVFLWGFLTIQCMLLLGWAWKCCWRVEVMHRLDSMRDAEFIRGWLAKPEALTCLVV